MFPKSHLDPLHGQKNLISAFYIQTLTLGITWIAFCWLKYSADRQNSESAWG